MKEGLEKIDINLKDWLSHKPHCLGGCTIGVLAFSDPAFISRNCEGKIMEGLRRDIEDGKMAHLSKHLPEVLMYYGDMSRYGTQRIRSLSKLSIEGCRTLRVLVSRKLAPLTSGW